MEQEYGLKIPGTLIPPWTVILRLTTLGNFKLDTVEGTVAQEDYRRYEEDSTGQSIRFVSIAAVFNVYVNMFSNRL